MSIRHDPSDLRVGRREAIKRIFAIGAAFTAGGLLVRQRELSLLELDDIAEPAFPFAYSRKIVVVREDYIPPHGSAGAFRRWAEEELPRAIAAHDRHVARMLFGLDA